MAWTEPDVEAFLLATVPELAGVWRGAASEDIDALERIAGRPLPPFYRWFLGRMGRDMGPLEDTTLDCTAQRILQCYREGRVQVDPRYFLIGYETDESVPVHLFYDLERPLRNDAAVLEMYLSGADPTDRFETFRERLAWGAMVGHRLQQLPQRCMGLLTGERGAILDTLEPVMTSLGFTQPVLTGTCCGVFDRHDSALACHISPETPPQDFIVFELGGSGQAALRRTLGMLASSTALAIEVQEWDPPIGEMFRSDAE